MSRSKLKSKWMNKKISSEIERPYSYLKATDNSHKFDEMPKNRPSKHITSKCAKAGWLQEPGTFGGHKPKKGGHRMVSGIVRAKTKNEIRKELEDESLSNFNFEG